MEHSTYALQYLSAPSLPMQLTGIGWYEVDSNDYYWDGLRRGGHFALFQFTVSGEGRFCRGGKSYALTEGMGFLCTVPSEHHYYYPQQAKPWEVLYIIIRGEDAINHFHHLIEKLGPVVSFREAYEPVRILQELYKEFASNPQMDKFTISAELYRFVTELHRMAEGKQADGVRGELPESILSAITFMENRYAVDLSVDEIAARAGLSKFHFCRQFQKKTGMKPMQYLRKIRIEKAAWLLKHTNKTVEMITKEVGFEYSNYFIKVFRDWVGCTPGDYRQGKKVQPSAFLRIEV